MKEATNIIARQVNVNTGGAEIDKILLGKDLSELVQLTSKLSANMGQAYNVILVHITTFTSSNIKSLKVWEGVSENSDMIVLIKGIKGLIFKHDNTEYFYTGMR